ncbi:MAG: glycosyl transferase family 90 [Rhodobacterales bacterium]|nr:glycosyl transferase family 90 [Rhodobacterales bacterium]
MGLSGFNARRIEVYLSGLTGVSDRFHDKKPDDFDIVFVCGASETKANIFRRYSHSPKLEKAYTSYVRQAQVLVRAIDPQANFAICPGDSRSRFSFPTMVKSRRICDRDAPCVLLPLNRERHWKDFLEIEAMDVPFKEKDDKIVWRGVTTGVFKSWTGGPPRSSRVHVARLAERKDMDVGFSKVVQLTPETSDIPMDQLRAALRPQYPIATQLRSKYLLSLEGNDVASGLKWMLQSNSVVLMPHPTCESWACEGELIPYVHFVPIKDDLSDIEDVHDWCRSHPSDCEAIAHNGKQFIGQFMNSDVERLVCGEVISAYLRAARVILSFGLIERLAQRTVTPIKFGYLRAQGKI